MIRWILAAVTILTFGSCRAEAADHDALWRIVSTQCMPNFQATGNPAPCRAMDSVHGYVILKDRNGAYQFLLIPTSPISGIEASSLLESNAPNYWQPAWEARRYVESALGHPVSRDRLSLAVNSQFGRSQNQLHIHIDCIGNAARSALLAHEGEITTQWSSLTILEHPYRVRRIENGILGSVDPFKMVADTLPGAKQAMGTYTILLAGTTFPEGRPGFYLLVDRAFSVAGDHAHAEELQDHGCVLALPN